MQLEQNRVGQLAHVVEAPLRPFPLLAGDARLPGGGDDAPHQRQEHQHRRSHAGRVAVHELLRR